MADLPMMQVPNFQLGAVPNNAPSVANAISGVQGGGQQAIQAMQFQQQLAQQKQLQQAQIQQMNIDSQLKVIEPLLNTGLKYQGLLPTFWPTIASSMNKLSPDYQLDPNNPPQNIKGWATNVYGVMQAVQNKEVTPQQAHQAVLQINGEHIDPNAASSGNSATPTAGTQGPQGPVMQAPPQGQPQQGPPQGTPPSQGQPPQGQQQPPMLPGQAAVQAGVAAVMNGPQDDDIIKTGLSAIKDTPEWMQFQNALELQKTQALQSSSQNFQAGQNDIAQSRKAIDSISTKYATGSQDFKNVADNFTVFNSQLGLASKFASSQDTTAAVNAEKTSLLSFAQMAYPGTGRPGNMEMLENMEKSGPYGTLIQQSLNKLDKGEIMTEKQIMGLRQAGFGIYQARELNQTSDEQSAAKNIIALGGNPTAYLQNVRAPGVISTSALYPSQSSDQNPAIGHQRRLKDKNGNVGMRTYLGNGGGSDGNWSPIAQDGQ